MRVSIVGVIADVRRTQENHFVSQRCCIFGITEEELIALQERGIQTRPRNFHPSADRYVLHCNPWKAMRVLGRFGYHFPCMSIIGLVEGASGERRTCYWTMISERRHLQART